MRAGELTETIKIQRQSSTLDANAIPQDTWEDLFHLRATYRPRGGTRNEDQLETWGGESAQFIVYYKPQIKATDRILYGGSVYQIVGEPVHRRTENMTIINANITRYGIDQL